MCVGGFRGRPRHLLDCGMARRKVRGLCRNEDEKRMKHGRTSPYPRAPVIAPKNVAKASHLCPTDKSICTARFPLAPEHRRPPQLRFSKNDCSASSLTRWASPTQPPPPLGLFMFAPPMAPAVAAAATAILPPLVLPPWLVGKDRYNIKLPHIDTLLAVADKGRRPRRNSCPIGPEPSGLYKTAQDTVVARNVPKLAVPPQYVPLPACPHVGTPLRFHLLMTVSVVAVFGWLFFLI